MNIKLTVISPAISSSHVFGAGGGVFGRSARCDWVLPDPDRVLSNVHGTVLFKNGNVLLIDESTNGIFVNGLPGALGKGNSTVLQTGTRFSAGPYLIEARIVPATESLPAGAPVRSDAAPSPARPGANPADYGAQHFGNDKEMAGLWGQGSQDPLQYLGEAAGGAGVQAPGSGFPDVMQGLGGGSGLPPRFGENAALGPDWDSGEFGTVPAASPPLRAPMPDIDLRSLTGSPDRPDATVRSGPAAVAPAVSSSRQDFTGGAAEAPVARQMSNAVIPEDFLSLIGAPPKANAASAGAAVLPHGASTSPSGGVPAGAGPIPEGNDPLTAFITGVNAPGASLPQAGEAAGEKPAESWFLPPHAQKPKPLSPALMADMVEVGTHGKPDITIPPYEGKGNALDAFEALKGRREQRKAALIEKAKSYSAPGPVLPDVPQAPAQGKLVPQERPIARGSAEAAPARTTGALESDMLRPLLEGMGFPEVAARPEDQDRLLRDAGEMLREMAAGLVLLLSARKLVKSEFRIDQTQIQPQENNPFKFFPVGELVLDELLLTRSGGYQPPAEATKSAFDDVQQHTLLTMSAMQRAITLLFERLSPKAITSESGEERGFGIRGMGGKKGHWETYVELHDRMSRSIDNLSRQIIADAFSQVHEEQARGVAKEFWEKRR